MSRLARVIVADPPWSFGDKLPGKGRGAEKHYKVLSLSDIQRFPFDFDVAEDAILFLWRVSSQVEEAYSVVRAWGFVPKAELVWVKQTSKTLEDDDAEAKLHFGMGHYTRAAHETCVIATKGSFKVADRGIRSVFTAPVGKHSEKPQAFFDLVEKLCGAKGDQNEIENGGPFIELFARKPRPGWHVFGNEIDSGPNKPVSSYVWSPKVAGTTEEELPPPGSAVPEPTVRAVVIVPQGVSEEIVGRAPLGLGWAYAKAIADDFVDPTPCEIDPSLPELVADFVEKGPLPPHVVADLGAHPAILPEPERRAHVERGVREGLLTADEGRDPADAWIKLQYRAPSGFFSPISVRAAPAPMAENLSQLAGDLKLADHPVHLVVLAGWSPFQRTMLAEWVRQRNLALVDSPLDLPPVPPFLAEEVAKNPKAELPADHAAKAAARVRIPANTPSLLPDVDASTVIENMSPSLAAVVAAGEAKAKKGRKAKGGSPQTEVSAASILGWDAAKKVADAFEDEAP